MTAAHWPWRQSCPLRAPPQAPPPQGCLRCPPQTRWMASPAGPSAGLGPAVHTALLNSAIRATSKSSLRCPFSKVSCCYLPRCLSLEGSKVGEDRGRNSRQVEFGHPFRLGTPFIGTDPSVSSPLLTHGLTGLSSLEVGHLEVVPGAGKGQGWGTQSTFQEAPISAASCLGLGVGAWRDSL